MFEKVDGNIEISEGIFIKVGSNFDVSFDCFKNVDSIFENVDGDF